MTKKIVARTMMIGAMLASTFILNGTATAQAAGRNASSSRTAAIGNASTATQLQNISNAISGVMLTDAFKRAERASDIRTMRALLSEYGLQVLDPEPQLTPICRPPYGVASWGWGNFNGTWMYGWICSRNGGTGLGNAPIDLPD
jgi:hypothetical protein